MADSPARASSRVLPLQELFAAPLVSVIEADVLAARTFAGFISEFGFDPSARPETADGRGTHFGALRTVLFTYKRTGANGELQDATVEIPLLSLVPLPLLQVTQADFSFDVRVLETASDDLGDAPPLLKPAVSAEGETSQEAPPANVPRVRAMLASPPRNESSSRDGASRRSELDANMSVKLSMKQADVPSGISAMLQLMGESVTTTVHPHEKET